MTVGLLGFGYAPIIGGLKIVLQYDSSVTGAPASFTNAAVSAANLLMSACPTVNITVNIQVGYNEWDNGVLTNLGTSATGSDAYGVFLSYSSIKSALQGLPNPTTALSNLISSLPSGTTLAGSSGFYVPAACCKTLGIGSISPTATAIDGIVGVGSSIGTGNLVGVFLHEMTHAMGREAGPNAPFCFSRFSAANTYQTSNSNSPHAYFSLNDGTTNLADYGTSSDFGDFENGGVQDGSTGASWQSFSSDCFDEFYAGLTLQTLTTADIQLLNAMGFY